MDIIDKILLREEFKNNPPVLIDIGASGEIHAKWKKIAKYAVCIAFDADDREMSFVENETSSFKKLLIINRIVTDKEGSEIDFYLTKSPFCSSTLQPDIEKLKPWSFQPLFEVNKKVKLKAITLVKALREANISKIDWFKTDTQGTDIRLFKSLPEEIRLDILAAEFEPGIIDAYKGEDKLFMLMETMNQSGFYMSNIQIKGTQRISPEIKNSFSKIHQKAMEKCLNISPCWGEVTYLNTLTHDHHNKRAYLLSYVFAIIEKQYGFAAEIADKAIINFNEPVFHELKKYAVSKIKINNLKWPFVKIKRGIDKIFRYIYA